MKAIYRNKLVCLNFMILFLYSGIALAEGEWAANGDKIYNTNSGNVGIGTTAPGAKLDVVGPVNLNGYRIETITDSTSWAGPAPELFTPLGRFSNNDPVRVVASDNGCGVTGGAEFYIVPSWDAGPEDIKVYSFGDTDEYPASEDDFIIYTERFNNGSFYLGIGNTSGCRDSSKSVVYTVMARDMETAKTDPVKANYTSMSTRKYLYSDDSGNVGIGTNSPQSKLAVNGTITAKEIKVTDVGWADFVFEENYQLPPLNNVESFIKKHKHLPDIPLASEVEQQGLAVSEMLAKQMQKIEELTLYIIEQNKKIEKLEEQMATLSACTNLN